MYKQKSQLWLTAFTLLIAALAMFMMGCESKSVLDETPENTQVTVSVSPASITQGTTTVVEASVRADATGIENQIVVFTVNPSSAGYFAPSVDTTDGTGIAATVFTGLTSGSATITASVSGTSFTGNIGITVNETAQTGSGNVDLNVSPSLLLANGSDTAQVTISVRDANSAPAPDSTLVKIVAGEKFVDIDENGYWSPGIDSLVFDANANGQWDAVGLIPSSAMTSGGTGTVTVNYISGNDAMTAYIKATVNDNGIEGSVELPIQLTPNASVNSIYLASDSMNLSVKQTGGIETGLIRATGYDMYGNPVPEGLTLNFIITDGPGGGEHLANVGYGPYAAVTNSQGIASVPLHSGTVSGSVRIRAYVDTVLSNATQVMISSGPPAYIVVGVEKCNVDYWDKVNETQEIVAVVSDIYLNPVNDSTVVYFSTDEGTMKSHEERTQEHEGVAGTIWISGNNVPTADGVVYVIAETSGGTVADTTHFYNSLFPDTLIADTIPPSMQADGVDKFTIGVTGIDYNENNRPDSGGGIPVIGGTAFDAECLYMNTNGGALQDGCYSSYDEIKVTSVVLDEDHSLTGANDDGIGAYDRLTLSYGASARSTYTIVMTTGYAYGGNSSITAQTTAAPMEVVNISCIIKDRFGNPLGDHTLIMTASDGTVSGATQETNGYGEATGFIWTAPNSAGSTATIVITDTDPRGDIVLTKAIKVEI